MISIVSIILVVGMLAGGACASWAVYHLTGRVREAWLQCLLTSVVWCLPEACIAAAMVWKGYANLAIALVWGSACCLLPLGLAVAVRRSSLEPSGSLVRFQLLGVAFAGVILLLARYGMDMLVDYRDATFLMTIYLVYLWMQSLVSDGHDGQSSVSGRVGEYVSPGYMGGVLLAGIVVCAGAAVLLGLHIPAGMEAMTVRGVWFSALVLGVLVSVPKVGALWVLSGRGADVGRVGGVVANGTVTDILLLTSLMVVLSRVVQGRAAIEVSFELIRYQVVPLLTMAFAVSGWLSLNRPVRRSEGVLLVALFMLYLAQAVVGESIWQLGGFEALIGR